MNRRLKLILAATLTAAALFAAGQILAQNARDLEAQATVAHVVQAIAFAKDDEITDALSREVSLTQFSRADTDCSAGVDFADIDSFVALLVGPTEPCIEGSGDINNDGAVDFNDIDGFVECLINSGCP